MGLGISWEGQTVEGRFPLIKYLGGSSNCAVFLTNIGGAQEAKAVIKLVLASSCDAEGQLAVWRQAVRLSHPNLIRVFDGGRCWLAGNDLVFVVTEYADESLGEVLPRRALNPAEGHAMLRPMIEALKYLHGQGLVHAHLRPSNIMAANEQLKLSSDGIRSVGEIKGPFESSIYDAPEVKTGKVSPASDVWSLGATLTDALTPKSTRQSGVYQGLPKPFDEIVQHCLRDEPAARSTLNDIEERLQTKAVERPVKTAPAVREIRPGMRRFVPLGLAVVLIVILAAIYGVVHSGSSRSQNTKVAQTPTTAAPATSAPTPVAPVANSNSAGAVLSEVKPAASQSSLRTIHGRIKVRLRVGVDAAGNVTTANLTTAGPSKYFARLATQAAQQWKFTAPQENGRAIPSQWTILFEYSRSGISEQASQTR